MRTEPERRLAAILAADVAGYSRLMSADEDATVRTLRAWREHVATLVNEHRGRLVDFTGDNFLAEFSAARDAVECALVIQRVIAARNEALSEARRMRFRIGAHLGDVRFEDGRLFGDGVNIAARLQALAEPGGLCLSAAVADAVRGKIELSLEDLGEQPLKNLPNAVRVFRVQLGVPAAIAARADVAQIPRRPATLAVLPFDNLSADPELLYFSDGVSEEILQTVARTAGLKVIGRSSSFQFRGRDKSARHVARELGCTHLLDGSVRRSGARVRVSAQLIECDEQTTLWSDRFDRDLTEVFALQDEIAGAIAKALQVEFSPVYVDAVDREAFDLYLQAKASTANWLGAHDAALLELAVARSPRFAKAWAALAVTRATEANLERDAERLRPLRQRAIEAANTALALDPRCGAAHIALGIVEPICGRFLALDERAEMALKLAPNDPLVLFWTFRWSRDVGRLQQSLDYITRAYAIDPLWPQGVHQYATALATAGREEESLRTWDGAAERWPHLEYLYIARVNMASLAEDWALVDALRTRIESLPAPMSKYARGALRDADRARQWGPEDTERLRAALAAEHKRTGTLHVAPQLACKVGLVDTVYELLAKSRFEHLFEPEGRLLDGEWALWGLFVRGGDALRRDVRFVAHCARLGLCDYWVRSERWPDCASELAPHYDFRAEARKAVAVR